MITSMVLRKEIEMDIDYGTTTNTSVFQSSIFSSSTQKSSLLQRIENEVVIHSRRSSSRIKPDMVAILIPAYNEKAMIGETIQSLRGQSISTDIDLVVWVIANNCKDNTADIARHYGAHVIEMPDNPFMKAGALNKGIQELLDYQEIPEFIITIDADTILDQFFVDRCISVMRLHPEIGVLGAVCRGIPNLGKTLPQKMLLWLQQAEYAKAGEVRMRQNIHTAPGAGSFFRMKAILDVLRYRPTLYKEHKLNLVEDFEATLEIKKRGWKVTNNFHCIAHTDLMPTIRGLFNQRIRWVRGTIDELRRRGWHKETRASIAVMALGMISIPVFYLWWAIAVWGFTSGREHLLSFAMLPLMSIYQAITLRKLGWKSSLVGALLVPDIIFAMMRHTWIVISLVKSYVGRPQKWSNS
jgi:cellulose synthase/poly-beta-1,6-N-acetylglucosamine synthase-like glycosyltransferase